MPDREKVIKEFEHLLNAAKGNYQDFVDLTVDGGEEILTLLKEQDTANLYKCPNCGTWVSAENVVRCKDCKHATMTADGKMCKYCEMDTDDFGDQREVYHDADWYCADGEKKFVKGAYL